MVFWMLELSPGFGSRKTDKVEAAVDRGVAHEPVPDVTSASVLCAEQGDADVDAYNICVHPAGCGIEGIGKGIPTVDLTSETSLHRFQSLKRNIRGEH